MDCFGAGHCNYHENYCLHMIVEQGALDGFVHIIIEVGASRG